MLSLKTSAALIVTLLIAVIAYLVTKMLVPESSAGIAFFLPSIFSVLTTIILIITSSLVQNSVTSPKANTAPVENKPVNKAAAQITGDIATLYVGNLAYKANEKLVQEHFETAGVVKSVRLVKDKKTGRRKGFGFIEVSTNDEATFIEKLNDSEFMERTIIVRPANEKQH